MPSLPRRPHPYLQTGLLGAETPQERGKGQGVCEGTPAARLACRRAVGMSYQDRIRGDLEAQARIGLIQCRNLVKKS